MPIFLQNEVAANNPYDARKWTEQRRIAEFDTYAKLMPKYAYHDVRVLSLSGMAYRMGCNEWADTLKRATIDALGMGHPEILYALEEQIDRIGRKCKGKVSNFVTLDLYDNLASHYAVAYGDMSWQRLDAERRRLNCYGKWDFFDNDLPGYNSADLERARKFLTDWNVAGLDKTFEYGLAVHQIAMLEYMYAHDPVRAANLEKEAVTICQNNIEAYYRISKYSPLDHYLTRMLLQCGKISEARYWADRESEFAKQIGWKEDNPERERNLLELDFALAEKDWLRCDSLALKLLEGWEKYDINKWTDILRPLAALMKARVYLFNDGKISGTNAFDGVPINDILNAAATIIDSKDDTREWFNDQFSRVKYEMGDPEVASMSLKEYEDCIARINKQNPNLWYTRRGYYANVEVEYTKYAMNIHGSLAQFCTLTGNYELARYNGKYAMIYRRILNSLKGIVGITDYDPDNRAVYEVNRIYLMTLASHDDKRALIAEGRKIFEEERDEIRKGFMYGSRSDRSTYMTNNGRLFTNTIATIPIIASGQPGANALACNNAIFVKGLQLNAERSLKDFLLNNSDSIGAAMLTKLQRLRASGSNASEQIRDLERKIVDRSIIYGDYTQGMFTNWTDVRDALSPDEAAVEFMVADNPGHKDGYYYALITKHDMVEPEYVALGSGADLKQFDFKTTYTTDSLSVRVWTPIADKLSGINTVYFSPAGILNNIAIEYLPLPESMPKNLWRVSSTRELCKSNTKHEVQKYKNIAVFGGAKFDNEPIAASAYEIDSQEEISTHEMNLRAGYEYLPGTLKEAENIHMVMGDVVRLYIGEDASETALKELSGSDVQILHVATHGFYWNEREARRNRNLKFLNNDIDREDRSMSRSGLLLSGANHTIQGARTTDGDDGILTAKEFSGLALDSVDLVVLSACQTGLGDVDSEGVCGLQRGLKKAGVRSILMSLWKVDDTATQKLMTRFYENLKNGASKREALTEARGYLRSTPEYSSPEYWAGFIMMD